ncbi:hypothetical protein [Peribacillus butanolivorans]|uniref:Uncharacterized protein n=1 Tax=Peribacillus butanolivorans TaxID=421767 RepID=A0ABM6XM53_9BACI|nr:hypothetical protein [Peribacillus butanolivorans]AXN39617.1 hypothetical protein DTO10_15415 [Peribacillus butanolivorans]
MDGIIARILFTVLFVLYFYFVLFFLAPYLIDIIAPILLVNINENSLWYYIFMVVIVSLLSYWITRLIHIIFEKCFRERGHKLFVNTFEESHMYILYFSGLLAVLTAFEPLLIKNKIIGTEFFEANPFQFFILLFFIALSNQNIYKTNYEKRKRNGKENRDW